MKVNSEHTYHHGDLQSALISASIQIINKEGVDGLSLREVAKIAGVSHTAPYRHFRNKAAILEAIANEGFDLLGSEIEAISNKYSHPRRQVTEAVMAYIHFVSTHSHMSQIMFTREAANDDGNKASGRLMQIWRKIIENGINARVFNSEDISDLTITIWSMMHGLSMLIVNGYLGNLAVTDKQRSRLAAMAAENLLEGLLK